MTRPAFVDLAVLIEGNVCELLLAMGAAGGGDQRADDEITWTVGGSPIGYHNAVVRCTVGSDTRGGELVEEWLTELRSHAVPGSWHLAPTMRPTRLPEMLVAAGFQDAGEEPAMAMALADLRAAPTPSGLDIGLVTDAGDLGGYRSVLAAGFGEGPKEADWVASIYATIGVGDAGRWRHLLGRVEGEPVATASVLLTGPTAGIYFVSTRPDLRRRGLGAAITHQAMVEAADAGAAYAVLGSSPMGQGIYERLGFRTVFPYRLFEWEP